MCPGESRELLLGALLRVAAVVCWSQLRAEEQSTPVFQLPNGVSVVKIIRKCFNEFAEVSEKRRLRFASIAAMPIANVITKNTKILKTWLKLRLIS